MRPTGVGALPAAASLTLTTYVAADPGSDAPDYALSEDGVPGTLVEEATGGRPIGEEVDEAGRDAAARAWSERRESRGVEIARGTHYVFLVIDADGGFRLGPPELTWRQPDRDRAGAARLRYALFGRNLCGA